MEARRLLRLRVESHTETSPFHLLTKQLADSSEGEVVSTVGREKRKGFAGIVQTVAPSPALFFSRDDGELSPHPSELPFTPVTNKPSETRATRLLRGPGEVPKVKEGLRMQRSSVEIGRLGQSRRTWNLTLRKFSFMQLRASVEQGRAAEEFLHPVIFFLFS